MYKNINIYIYIYYMCFLFISVDAFPSWNWELFWAKSIPQSHKLEVVQSFLSPVVRFFYGSSEPHQWHQEIDSLPLGLRRTRCRFTSVWWKVASQPSTSIASTKDSPGRACEDVEHVGPWLAGKFIDYQQHATRMFMLDRYIIIAVDVLPICNTRKQCKHCLAVWCSLHITCFDVFCQFLAKLLWVGDIFWKPQHEKGRYQN